MIKIRQLKVSVNSNTQDQIKQKIALKLNINLNEIDYFQISKQSIDARKAPKIFFVYEVIVKIKNENIILKKFNNNDVCKYIPNDYKMPKMGAKKINYRPIIVGSGPSGLLCAYMLAYYNYKPIIIERGEDIPKRNLKVEKFWKTNKLDLNSNVQFGLGGAGTFSDGKLNTLVKDKRNIGKKVFEIFVECGAPKEIMYLQKPHIGTDKLKEVVANLKLKIEQLGGEFRFNSCLTNIIKSDDCISQIEINNKDLIPCELLVLAIGHSARDTFYMLNDNNIAMQSKPFAVGIRISHPQKMINESQYKSNKAALEAASYKLTYNTKEKRGVYSFCMCPGGYVVNASSEKNRLAINGMSNYKRDSLNANSAIVVSVSSKDYGSDLFDGIEFQRRLEERAYKVGKTNIPIQLYKDYKLNQPSCRLENVEPIFKGNYTLTNLNDIFPKFINDSLIEAIEYFSTKIPNFNRDDSILAAVESRTSSPIRILRDNKFQSNIKGIYPCGEGAGYAGGITTSAIDGIKVAEAIISEYSNIKRGII